MNTEQKHYYAFISHSSEDGKTASWLRDQLEQYHIPSAVQKDYHAPRSLKPIFVYQTDIVGNNLSEALRRSLFESRYLIVICSPAAAQSVYVNGEIQYFIDHGWSERIIPFIISGTPFAEAAGRPAEEECFPPALRNLKHTDKELRGINLPEAETELGTKIAAVVNVIATMLGVRFDMLWDRYRQRRIRKYLTAAAAAMLLVLLGLFVWEYTRPTYRYFADYVDKWGVPEGVVELTKEQKSHRNRMYRFEYRRIPFGEPNAWQWRVKKVSYVNSADEPVEYTNQIGFIGELIGMQRTSILEVTYNKQDGVPMQWIYRNYIGKVKLRHTLSQRNGKKAAVADLVNAKESQGVGYAAATERNSYNIANIVRFAYERDVNGYIIRQTFHANNDYNLNRSAARNEDGIYGYAYVVDSLGRRTQATFLDMLKQPTTDKRGVAGQKIEYDEYGNICRLTYIDKQGNPTWGYYGRVSTITYTSDTEGNIREEVYLNPNGQLGNYHSFLGKTFSRVARQYDEHGYEIEEKFFKADNSPCELPYFGHISVCHYDKKGRIIDVCTYDTASLPFLTDEEYFKTTYKYDAYGNTIERAYYGADGKLCGGRDGVAIWRCRYDGEGNLLEHSYYDSIGNLCIDKSRGYAKRLLKYDDYGNEIELTYCGTDGLPMMYRSANYATCRMKYDDRGNCIEEAYFDSLGNPCETSWEKCSILRMQYDDSGNEIEQSFYDVNGKPCLCKRGYAKMAIVYDEHGNEIECAFYDTNNRLCLRDWGCAKWKSKHDDRGNEIERVYYGLDDKPCMLPDGFSKWIKRYNDQRSIIEASYFDTKGKPSLFIDSEVGISYARYTCEYDDRGNLKEKLYFDMNGKEVQIKQQ